MRVFVSSLIAIMFALFLLVSNGAANIAYAQSKPVHTEILDAGPYKVVVGLSEYPPIVGDSLVVTVQSTSQPAPLTGQITAQPGLGTDSIPNHATFTTDTDGTLDATIHLSVKGAWTLVLDLDGAKGHGTASLDVIVSAPNAMAPWIGWLIGLSPLVGCVWLGWWLWNYRRRLLTRKYEQYGQNGQHGQHEQPLSIPRTGS